MAYETSAGAARTLSAMFDTRAEAERAIAALEAEGIYGASLTGGDDFAADRDPAEKSRGFFESLSDFFFPDDDRRTYAEGLARGGFLVTLANLPPEHYDRATEILDDEGAIDLGARETEWRTEGWAGPDEAYDTSLGDTGTATPAAAEQPYLEGDLNRDGRIDVVEERLILSKRETDTGRVRVRSYVREVPVEEEVELRSQRVNVERRAVDRAADGDAFRDQTIEAREYTEEPVVQKEARVVEEIDISSEEDRRRETVRDSVRKTEVEIDDERLKDR